MLHMKSEVQILCYFRILLITDNRPYCIGSHCRLHKPVSDWLKTLPHRISGLNMQKKFLLDIIEMERNDLWLNVKGNYIYSLKVK